MGKQSDVSFAVLTTIHAGCEPNMLVMALMSVQEALQQSSFSGTQALYLNGSVPDSIRQVIRLCSDGALLVEGDANRGPAAGLNTLIDTLGSVDFLLIHDADDVMLPSRPETQIQFLLNHPEIAFCGGQAAEYNTDTSELRMLQYPQQHDDILRSLSRRNPFAHSTVCFRSSLFHRENYRYNTRLRRVVDFDLLSRLLAHGKAAANLDKVVTVLLVDDTFARRRKLSYFYLEFPLYMKWIKKNRDVTGFLWLLLRGVSRALPQPVIRLLYRIRHRFI